VAGSCVVEIEAAAAVVGVDLLWSGLGGIGPVVEAARRHAGEDRVEIRFTDEKGIVLQRRLAVLLVKVERGAVVQGDHHERPEADGRRPPQDIGQKACRLLLVAAPDDGVIEFYRHAGLLA
jgi:hypothetical protein